MSAGRDCCRTCMDTTSLVPLQTGFIDFLNLTTGLNVQMKDTLPQQICKACVDNVNNNLMFRKKCLTTEKLLVSLLKEDKTVNNITNNTPEDCDGDKNDKNTNIVKCEVKQETPDQEKSIYYIELAVEETLKQRTPIEIINDSENDLSSDTAPVDCNSDHDRHSVKCEVKIESPEGDEKSPDVLQIEKTVGEILKQPTPIQFYNIKPFTRLLDSEKIKLDPIQISYKCEICQKTYDSRHLYETHKRDVHNIHRSYKVICEHCGNQFYHKSMLLAHCKAKHGYKKTDKCSYCDYVAIDKMSVKIHERIHTGEKPFACEVCDARFHRKLVYLQHRARHVTDKTVKCDLCPALFGSKQLMYVHKHHKHRPKKYKYKFKCVSCGSMYAKRWQCTRHVQKIHGAADAKETDIERVKITDAEK